MEFSPSIESVQLCLDNYSRLMYDSEKVSDQTSFALRELGLEELVKAWMLYFAYFLDVVKQQNDQEAFFRKYFTKLGINISDLVSVNNFSDQNKDSLQYTRSELKKLFNPNISNAFKFHSVKLDYLSSILKYLELLLPSLEGNPNYKPYDINKIIGEYLKSNELDQDTKKDLINKILDIIKKFDIDEMKSLQKKKEQAFYTDLVEGNKIVIPKTRLFDNESIKKLNDLLYENLIGEINILIDL